MAKTTPVTITNKPWRVRWHALDDAWGKCTPEDQLIQLHPDCERVGNTREVLIHEMLHAFFWQVDESCIKMAAREIDEALEAFDL